MKNIVNSLTHFPNDIDWIAFIDESGNNDIQKLLKQKKSNIPLTKINPYRNHVYFCISACVFTKLEFEICRKSILHLKNKFWQEGKYSYNGQIRRVCFHSRDIRRKSGPFKMEQIDYNAFIEDLKLFLENANFKIVSSFMNKAVHVQKYNEPYPVYCLNLQFIIERLIRNFSGNGILIAESRGYNNDIHLKEFVESLLRNGSNYVAKQECAKIKGIYFNNKWSNNYQQSYLGNEIADLVAYSISRYCSIQEKDIIFSSIESKLDNYPNFWGYGIKKFP